MFSNSKAGRGARQSLRSPQFRIVTGTVVAAVAVSSFAFGGTTSGAATLPNSQSVGRFVDGSAGTTPIESLVNAEDARAVNPGSVSDQNPLNVKVLKAIDLPLTGALQLPQLLGIKLGAVNQVASAHSDGYSYGASGAVNNSGGVSVGGNNAAYPANATIDLSATGIAGNAASAGNILGGVHVNVGAVSALAATPVGVAKGSSTQYQIASLTIDAGSPLLGNLLSPVLTGVSGLLGSLSGIPSGVLPAGCSLSVPSLSKPISLEGGAIILDAKTGGLTIDLEALLKAAGLDLNKLPANTDLLKDVVTYLSSPAGLKDGLDSVLFTDLLTPLNTQFQACISALNALPQPLGSVLSGLLTTLTGQLPSLQKLVDTVTTTVGTVLSTAPLATIVGLLEKLVDIGVNVQPNGAAGTYTDALKATPAQDTPVVAGQTVVRAIELNLLGNAINVALANAAAGPSAATTPTTPPTSAPPSSNIPTGVPAGLGTKGGTPALPLILLLVGLVVAGGGVTAQRLRLRRNH